MDPLDDYAYNHLSDHLTDLEDERRTMRVANDNLIKEGRGQYANALFTDKLAKLDSAISSTRQALRLITEAFKDWSEA